MHQQEQKRNNATRAKTQQSNNATRATIHYRNNTIYTMWLAHALDHTPLNRGKYSNIKRLGLKPPHNQCSACEEIDASMQGTEQLTWELLKRIGRVKACDERFPFRVSVRFENSGIYGGTMSVIKAKPDRDTDVVVKIEFDDGDTELYTQEELYKEITGI